MKIVRSQNKEVIINAKHIVDVIIDDDNNQVSK